jgi:hypothetical protein
VGRAGLLHDSDQSALAQYFKTKKPSSELVVSSYLKHCGESRILLRNILHSYALKIHQTKKTLKQTWRFSFLIYLLVGRAGFEPAKFSQQIYSLPSLAA